MKSNIIIPCDSCVHKDVCKYEELTREYVHGFFPDIVPMDLKAGIKFLEVECEYWKGETDGNKS